MEQSYISILGKSMEQELHLKFSIVSLRPSGELRSHRYFLIEHNMKHMVWVPGNLHGMMRVCSTHFMSSSHATTAQDWFY